MLHAIERQPKRRRGDPINGKDEFNDMETRTWNFPCTIWEREISDSLKTEFPKLSKLRTIKNGASSSSIPIPISRIIPLSLRSLRNHIFTSTQQPLDLRITRNQTQDLSIRYFIITLFSFCYFFSIVDYI